MLKCEDWPLRRLACQKWKHLEKGLNARISKQEATCEPGRSAIFGDVILLKLRFLWCWCVFSCKTRELTFSVVLVPCPLQNLSEASRSRKARSVKVSPEILGLQNPETEYLNGLAPAYLSHREMLKVGDRCG